MVAASSRTYICNLLSQSYLCCWTPTTCEGDQFLRSVSPTFLAKFLLGTVNPRPSLSWNFDTSPCPGVPAIRRNKKAERWADPTATSVVLHRTRLRDSFSIRRSEIYPASDFPKLSPVPFQSKRHEIFPRALRPASRRRTFRRNAIHR